MFFWKKVSIFAQNDYLQMKNRRQFPSLCRYFFLSYPTKKGGFLFLPVLQGFKTPARTPYIVKLYAKIFISMFACPFSLQKSYPFFLSLFWVFSVFSVVFCIKKTLRPPVETQFDGGCFQQREREFHAGNEEIGRASCRERV